MRTGGSLHIVTVSTDIKYYMPYLIESIKKHNGELTILGLNMKWLGFNWKLKMVKEHLLKLPEDDIVCVTDAYDVLCVRDLNEMIDEFNRIKNLTGCKIIGSSDFIYGRKDFFSSLFYTGRFTNNVVNGGLYIGCVKDLIDMYNIIHINYGYDDYLDDQMLINKFNNKHPGYIYIDKKSELFYTLAETNEYIKIKNKILNKPNDLIRFVDIKDNNVYSINNTRPFFIHAYGNGYLDTIIRKLEYNINKDTTFDNTSIKKQFNKKLTISKSFLILFLYNLLFIILIISIIYLLVNW